MTKRILCLLSFLTFIAVPFSTASAAVDAGIAAFIGFNTTEYSSDNISFDRQFGLEFGGQTLIPVGSQLWFRTGGGIVQKNSESKDGVAKYEYKVLYIEIPVTLMYAFSDSFSGFGGFNLDLQLSDDCKLARATVCNLKDFKGFVMNLALGGRFNISGPHFVEVPLEIGLTNMASETALGGDAKISTSLSARYAYEF